MKTSIIFLFLLFALGSGNIQAAKPRFFICTTANNVQAEAYMAFFESRVFNELKKNFPCVEINSQSTVRSLLNHERERHLLGSGDDNSVNNIAQSMGCNYLISLKVTVMGETAVIDAFCADNMKAKVIARAATSANHGDAGINAVEKVSKELIEGLKRYEICPFKGNINIIVKTELKDNKTEEHAVFCNGGSGLYRYELNIDNESEVNWKLTKTTKNQTSGIVTYRLREESNLEEQNDCAPCKGSNRQAPRMFTEKVVKNANVEGLSNESVSEGMQIEDARTEIIFNEDDTYLIRIKAASRKGDLKTKTDRKTQGSCDNSSTSDPENRKADVPLSEILGPFKGTALDKMLSGQKTDTHQDPLTKEKTTITYDFSLSRE